MRATLLSEGSVTPEVVEELRQGRVLLGNTPGVLRQVRDWRTLRAFCYEEGIPSPTTLLSGEEKEEGKPRMMRSTFDSR